MKRKWYFALAIVLCIGLLAGCAEGGEQQAAAEDELATLTILIDRDQTLDQWEAVFALMEEEIGVSTVIDLRPGGPEGENLVRTRLASGDMSDLMFFNSGALFAALNPTEYFVDLTGQPFLDRLDNAFLESVTVDGQIFGVAAGTAGFGGWLYNMRVYEELGLSVPLSWAQLMENNQVILDAGIIPVIAPYRDSWTSQLVLLTDFYYLHRAVPTFAEDFTFNRTKFAAVPEALRGFEKLSELYHAGFINADASATSFDMAVEMLAYGEGAHWPMLNFALDSFELNFPEYVNDIGFFAQPGDDPGVNGLTIWTPGAVYIYNRSENIDAALRWMDFLMTPQAQYAMFEVTRPTGPPVIAGVSLPEGALPAVLHANAYFEEGRTAPALEFITPLKGPNLPQITQELGLGASTPLQAAERYDIDNERQAIQLGLEGW